MHLDPLVPLRALLYLTAALLACLLLRGPLRRWLDATAAYAIWTSVPLAVVAAMLPGPPATTALPRLPTLVAMPVPLGAHGGGQGWIAFLVAAWLVGAVLMAVALCWRQQRFVRSLGPLHALGSMVWTATHDVGLPASLGIWRPRIVVPMDFNARYSADERALILAHERLHLRRGDLHANLLAAVLLCIAWFNPLMHLAWRAFRLDQELACDAAVLMRYPGQRRSYAATMLKCQLGSGWTPLACHWAASHPLTQRIAALRGPVMDAHRAGWNLRMVLLLALTGSAACWALQPARTAASVRPTLAAGNALDFATAQPPKYPRDALAADIEGSVVLQIEVDPRGAPRHIVVVQSRPVGVFDQAVVDAAHRWRFKPAHVDGKAVSSTVRVPVKFELDASDTTSADAGADATRSAAARPDRLASCASAQCATRGVLR